MTSLDDSIAEYLDEIISLNNVRISSVLIADKKEFDFPLCHAFSAKIKTIEGAVLEVFLRAVPLALREYTEDHLDVAVQRSKLARDSHHNVLFPLLVVVLLRGRLYDIEH